nr:reverse transcriptase domain-containing protein [Tanacetum cinerariifolium]
MHTRAYNSKLVEPLPERERTLNRRLRRRNRRVPFDQRSNPPQHPRIVYPSILDINYFGHFLITLQNLNHMDDKSVWAADRVIAPTFESAIIIPETANEFAIKDTENEAVRLMMFPLSLTGEAKTWLDKLNEETIDTIKTFNLVQNNKNLNDDDIHMSREEESKFMQTLCRTRFYNDYRDCDSNRDKWYSSGRNDYNRDNYQSHYDDKPDLQKQLSNFIKAQHSTNSFVKDTFIDLKKIETTTKNHQASIQNLEANFDRFADKPYGRPSGSLPSNTQPNLKAGMPNYGKFLKELVNNKHKIEQISAAFISDESSVILQNKVPSKLGDPESFLIPCNFKKAFSCNALVDLDASINLMPYSLYAKLSLETLKPTKMSVRLADRSFQYPVGIAENMLVEVGKFTFPADFVILEMEEDSKVILILGRPFLHTADAVIRVKQNQLNLKVGTKRKIFHINFAMKHSYSNDDTCFSIDVIDEILEEDFDALLDKGSEILHSIEGTILEEKLFAEFDEFMAMTAAENSESESDTKEPPFEKITFNTDYKIKTSLEELPTDLELKPLPDNLEYVFLEELSFLPVIISSQLSEENKNKLRFDNLCSGLAIYHSGLKCRRVSERAFMTLVSQDNETFTSTMFLYVDQLQKQLDKDEFQEDKSMAAFCVLNNQIQKFIDWQYFLDYDSEMTEKLFVEYTGYKVKKFREALLLHMGNVKKSIVDRTRHKRHGTKSDEHITSSSSGTYITHLMDADIRLVNDQVPSAELQAKNSTINNLKKQIKNVHVKSNEAKVKHDIDVTETINFELEHKVAKLLKENKTLKKHYKDLYDSIKIKTTKTIEQTASLIIKNDEFKAQLQEKGFTIPVIKNELRKLTGNSVNTKFEKPSILGKLVLQPLRNQYVVRQPTAFRSERPKFSKPRLTSQVDVNNVLSKPVTPHYLPKVRESVFVKPNHVVASGSSRNSSKESYGSNDMAHNYYLEEAK